MYQVYQANFVSNSCLSLIFELKGSLDILACIPYVYDLGGFSN